MIRQRKAFTLIEVLIAITILATMGTLAAQSIQQAMISLTAHNINKLRFLDRLHRHLYFVINYILDKFSHINICIIFTY